MQKMQKRDSMDPTDYNSPKLASRALSVYDEGPNMEPGQ